MDGVTDTQGPLYTAQELFHFFINAVSLGSATKPIRQFPGDRIAVRRPRDFLRRRGVASGWVYLTTARPDIDLDYAAPTREAGVPIPRFVLSTGIYLLDARNDRVIYLDPEPIGKIGGKVYTGDELIPISLGEFADHIKAHFT